MQPQIVFRGCLHEISFRTKGNIFCSVLDLNLFSRERRLKDSDHMCNVCAKGGQY